jgi:hypothetical protein
MTRSSEPVPALVSGTAGRVRMLLAVIFATMLVVAGVALAAPAHAKTGFPQFESVTTTDCGYAQRGEVSFETYLIPGDTYQVVLATSAGAVIQQWDYTEVHSAGETVPLDPGDYVLTLTLLGPQGTELQDQRSFVIGPCSELDLALLNPTCSLGADGTVTLQLLGLIVGEEYSWWAGPVSGSSTAEADTAEIPISGLAPGNYEAYVQWVGEGGVYDWRAFAIEPCQPHLQVTVAQCTVAGGTGGAQVSVTGLLAGTAFTLTGPDGSSQPITGQATTVDFAGLASGAYTVSVAGSWTAPPYEEPPYIGGGDFLPLETVALTAAAEFTVDPCPVAVTTTSGETKPVLAASGLDGVSSLLAGGAASVAAGCILFIWVRRSRAGLGDRR